MDSLPKWKVTQWNTMTQFTAWVSMQLAVAQWKEPPLTGPCQTALKY